MEHLVHEQVSPLSIAFATRSVPIHGRTPWNSDLGGSESALVFAARALAARGHHVDVYTRCDVPGVHDDVTWHDIALLEEHARLRDWDVFVSLRFPELLEMDVRADLRVLWCQDVLRAAPVADWMAWGDVAVFVSRWHLEDTIRTAPALEPFAEVVPNSIYPPELTSDDANRDLACVHLSRPERGLQPLLTAWPSVNARVPGSRLLVARYRSFHEPKGSEIERFCREMDERVQSTSGAAHLGHLSKPELYRVLSRSALMVYPAEFDETSCIAAIEAQACGLPVVAVRRGALPETLHPDACVLVEPGDEMPTRFADRVVELLFDHARCEAMSRAGVRHATRYHSDVVAATWEDLFLRRLADRPSSTLPPVAATAPDPGWSTGLRDAVASRVEGAGRVAVVGGEWPGATRVEPFSQADGFDAALDLGGVEASADPVAFLDWFGGVAHGPLVHVLRDVGYHEVYRWFGDGCDIGLTLEAETPWGHPARRWIVQYRSGEAQQQPAYAERATLRRPVPTVSACMIVRDAEDTVFATLRSIACIADEIRVVDTGSTDSTLEVVAHFARNSLAPVHVRRMAWPDDFSVARNASIEEAAGDWILWIDADERLIGGERLRRLIQSPLFEAYALRQHNHIFDHGVTQVEIPFRLFRNGRGYRFFGAVHEHPEKALNETIEPWTVAPGVDILHYGYLTERTRQRKLLDRNLRLLNLEQERYPGRALTDILYLRDCVNLARFDLRASRPVRPDHRAALEAAVERFEARYLRARDRYYHLGRGYYDHALLLLGAGHEIVVQVGPGADQKTHRWRHAEDALLLAHEAAQVHVAQALGGAP